MQSRGIPREPQASSQHLSFPQSGTSSKMGNEVGGLVDMVGGTGGFRGQRTGVWTRFLYLLWGRGKESTC